MSNRRLPATAKGALLPPILQYAGLLGHRPYISGWICDTTSLTPPASAAMWNMYMRRATPQQVILMQPFLCCLGMVVQMVRNTDKRWSWR